MWKVDREQLHQQTLRAREDERKRVARELHDQIIQALVGLNYQLSDMRPQVRPELDVRIAQLQSHIRKAMADVRRICSDLRLPALDSRGLVAAVRSHLRALERQTSFRVVLRLEGNAEQQLPDDVALCIFRVLQEALTNVQEHAAARQVEVDLLIRPDEVRLTVQDDGEGFHLPQDLNWLLDDHHFGLVGLRERLALIHGTLEVVSAPGQGTRVCAWVPVPQPDGPPNGEE